MCCFNFTNLFKIYIKKKTCFFIQFYIEIVLLKTNNIVILFNLNRKKIKFSINFLKKKKLYQQKYTNLYN